MTALWWLGLAFMLLKCLGIFRSWRWCWGQVGLWMWAAESVIFPRPFLDILLCPPHPVPTRGLVLLNQRAEQVLAGKDPGINVQDANIIVGAALKVATSAVWGSDARTPIAPLWLARTSVLGGSLGGLQAALSTCSIATVRCWKALIRAKKFTCVLGFSGRQWGPMGKALCLKELRDW